MEQTIRLAADADGVLLGVEHAAVNNAGLVETHVEPATEASKSIYASPSIRLRLELSSGSASTCPPRCAPPSRDRAVGAGERDERARRRRRRSTRSTSGWPTSPRCRRPTAGRGRATGCARPTRRVRAVTAGATATPERPRGRAVADRARDGHLLDGQLPVPRCRAGPPVRPTAAPWSRATCTTSAAARRPCCPDRGRGAGRTARPGRSALGRHRPPAHRAHLRLVHHDGHRQRGRGGRARRQQAAGRPRDRRRRPHDGSGRASTSSSARAVRTARRGRCSTATARARPTPCAPGARSSSRWASTRTSACCGCGARSASTPPGASSTRSRRGRR